jgi:hypothetical protein
MLFYVLMCLVKEGLLFLTDVSSADLHWALLASHLHLQRCIVLWNAWEESALDLSLSYLIKARAGCWPRQQLNAADDGAYWSAECFNWAGGYVPGTQALCRNLAKSDFVLVHGILSRLLYHVPMSWDLHILDGEIIPAATDTTHYWSLDTLFY